MESLYLNLHSSIRQITSDLALYINVCYHPLLGEYNLKIPHQHHHSGKNTTHSNETIGYFKNLQLIFFLVTLFVNLWRNFITFQSTQYPVNFTLLASWKQKKPRSLQNKFYLEFQMSVFKPWRRMKQAVVKNVIAFRFVLNLLPDFWFLFWNIELHFTG